MIEKDSGWPTINCLRIIQLFEAGYNLFLKLQWGSLLFIMTKNTVGLMINNSALGKTELP